MDKIQTESQDQKNLIVTWEEFDSLTLKLAKNIRDSMWEFDNILCIARGGMFVGDPLSRLFQKPLAIMCASSYRGNRGKEQAELYVSKNIAMISETLGKKVLLVDDLVDSGETLIEIKQIIANNNSVEEVRSAVFWKKKCSQYNPDYYADEVESGVWIRQPFEKFDEISLESLT